MLRSTPSPARELRSNLRHSWIDGLLFSGMVGVGETYLPAFVLASGHGELASGLVATVPMLTGALLSVSINTYPAERFELATQWRLASRDAGFGA